MSLLDVKSLTNSELKEQLLKRGVRSGPILPTTRKVYEKKLLQMLDQGPLVPQVKQNGTGDVDQYSDSEEEGLHPDNGTVMKSDEVTSPASNTSSFGHSKRMFDAGAGYGQTSTPSDTHFSLTKMVEQESIESSGRTFSVFTEHFSRETRKTMRILIMLGSFQLLAEWYQQGGLDFISMILYIL